jgi:hypothetical protein
MRLSLILYRKKTVQILIYYDKSLNKSSFLTFKISCLVLRHYHSKRK